MTSWLQRWRDYRYFRHLGYWPRAAWFKAGRVLS